MAIVVTLDEMLHLRRMTLTELSTRVGITLANLSILKTGKARGLRFQTLAAICAALDCQPGDILRYDPAIADLGRARQQRLLRHLGERGQVMVAHGLHQLAIKGLFAQEVAQPARGHHGDAGLAG